MVLIGNRFTPAFEGSRPNEPTPAPPGPDIRVLPDYQINGRRIHGQLAINDSTDPDPTVASVEIDWADGTPREPVTAPYDVVHEYAIDAVYPLRVYATDVDGRTTQAGAQVWAFGDPINLGPDPVADFTVAPEPSEEGDEVTFDASASTPDPGISDYEWTVVTQAPLAFTGKVVEFTSAITGLHVMRLIVYLPDGRSDMSQRQFNINPAAEE
jgi:hypothetical protein